MLNSQKTTSKFSYTGYALGCTLRLFCWRKSQFLIKHELLRIQTRRYYPYVIYLQINNVQLN